MWTHWQANELCEYSRWNLGEELHKLPQDKNKLFLWMPSKADVIHVIVRTRSKLSLQDLDWIPHIFHNVYHYIMWWMYKSAAFLERFWLIWLLLQLSKMPCEWSTTHKTSPLFIHFIYCQIINLFPALCHLTSDSAIQNTLPCLPGSKGHRVKPPLVETAAAGGHLSSSRLWCTGWLKSHPPQVEQCLFILLLWDFPTHTIHMLKSSLLLLSSLSVIWLYWPGCILEELIILFLL